MTLKITVQGEPEEIASFFATVEKCECLALTYSTPISKRASHHKWGSARCGITVGMVTAAKPDVQIFNRRKSRQQTKKFATKGFVYLMPAFDSNGQRGYKIGKTVNPKSRKKTFSVKMPYQVEFLAIISTDDYSAMEVRLHALYAHKRVYGEFFDLSDAEVKVIIGMMSAADLQMLSQLHAQFSS